MATGDKRAELMVLTRKRQAARWPGYNCIGDYHGGIYECDFVSPFTKSACNTDADIMVMLQDWASHDYMRGAYNPTTVTLGYTPSGPTNINLTRLLRTTFGLALGDTYGTNLFPFIKMGAVNAPIPRRDMLWAAREYGHPQIRIVKPKLVICFGLATFNALWEACGGRPYQKIGPAIDNPFRDGSTLIWCQSHAGTLGQNNRGGANKVSQDWQKMKNALQQSPPPSQP
jgi:restriction system protein